MAALGDVERDEAVSRYLSTTEGRRRLAESMIRPLRGVRPIPVCPVCGTGFRDLGAHCREVGDDLHLAVEVMET